MAAEITESENTPYISYGEGGATFIRLCPECARFVTADKTVTLRGCEFPEPVGDNATCKRHGRVQMPFIGFV